MKRASRFILILVLGLSIWDLSPAVAQSPASNKVTLFKEWRFINGPEEEMLRFNAHTFYTWLGGAGLSKAGVAMDKKIAEIIPGPTSASGRVIIGPDSTSYHPYWVIHWFDLSAQEVKLAIGKKTYPSAAAAKKEDKLDTSRAKAYRALIWGIY
jgi:hypothetical protein